MLNPPYFFLFKSTWPCSQTANLSIFFGLRSLEAFLILKQSHSQNHLYRCTKMLHQMVQGSLLLLQSHPTSVLFSITHYIVICYFSCISTLVFGNTQKINCSPQPVDFNCKTCKLQPNQVTHSHFM